MQEKAIAHVNKVSGETSVHDLSLHLSEVARRAGENASPFGGQEWAYFAGLWHDLGKFRPGFQKYIRAASNNGAEDAHIEKKGKVPHSTAGALLACQCFEVRGRVLAYLIASHHAGLYDWNSDASSLMARLESEDAQRELAEALAAAPPDLVDGRSFRPDLTEVPGGSAGFAFWVRMLFSALVDADFLDTESFMNPTQAGARAQWPDLAWLRTAFDSHMAALTADAPSTPVNQLRARILAQCRAKASQEPGIFSLTVPTGGGKTLASMAFALDHALQYGKRRIIYVIPYTSIIEQTADVFRSIFGDAVIEHHSNTDSDAKRETLRSRLACENWDAPIIVTTSVQFFESLFAARTSRCRKLHNLVGSVVVLDEAQLLPVPYLQPVVDVLRLLVKDYGVTLVLCTATQPTLESRNGFDQARQLRGFAAGEIREIVDDVAGLYSALERVKVHLPADLKTPCNWEQLAPQIAGHDAVLAVVGRRADARELYTRVKAENRTGLWHLSGLMCAQHRSDTIADIKQALLARRQALAAGQNPAPIRVISTQLVEAGVDIDFPVVYRALAGLDSIAQAAGRCNREGRLDKGEVHVFVPPKPAPPGLLRMAEQATRILWEALPPEADPMGVERFADFFRRLYGDADLDAKDVCNLLRVGQIGDVNFRTAAERFRLIDEAEGATVFVRYKRDENDEEIDMWLNTLKKEGPQRWLLRKLQRYGVSIYQRDLQRLEGQGDIEPLGGDFPGLYVQSFGNDVLYDRVLGINVDGAPGDPALLTI